MNEDEAADIEDEAAPAMSWDGVVPVAQRSADADAYSKAESFVSCAKSTSTENAERSDLNSDSSVQCPITMDVMRDPVTAADGRNYEQAAIEAHIATGRATSPMTNAPLPSLALVPNRQQQRRCQEFERKQQRRRQQQAQRGGGGAKAKGRQGGTR